MKVIIMRGIPGSGKSTWIKTNRLEETAVRHTVCSADDYYTDDNGNYLFKIENAAEAHARCLRKFISVIMHSIHDYRETVVVDNTNSTAWEIAPYYAIALAHGLETEIVRIHCDYETACKRNIHGVPPETIWRMHQNLLTERLPGHWKERIIIP